MGRSGEEVDRKRNWGKGRRHFLAQGDILYLKAGRCAKVEERFDDLVRVVVEDQQNDDIDARYPATPII